MISDEMQLANMFIGYFVPSGKWPCPFQSLGLQLLAIHAPFTSLVDGQSGTVKPEAVLASRESGYGVGLEVKSSRVSESQLIRYARLEPASVRRGLGFSADISMNYDTAFLTEDQNGDKLVRFIERLLKKQGIQVNGEDTFPVVVRNGNGMSMRAGALGRRELQEALATGVVAKDDDQPPTHFIRFSSESSHASMLDDVLNFVHGRITKQVPFSTRDVCVGIIGYWDVYGTEEKRALANKVQRILTRAAKENYKPFFKVANLSQDWSDTVWQPIDKSMNVQRIQAMSAANRGFLNRYRDASDEDFRKDHQLPLSPTNTSRDDNDSD